MTTEEILTNKGQAYEYKQSIIVTPVSHVTEVFQPLLTELCLLRSHQQTLLDEVNRLNAIIAGSCGSFADGLGYENCKTCTSLSL